MSQLNSDDTYNFLSKSQIGDYEITITGKKQKNIMDVLDKFNDIKNNDAISNEEKNMKVQKVINEYME